MSATSPRHARAPRRTGDGAPEGDAHSVRQKSPGEHSGTPSHIPSGGMAKASAIMAAGTMVSRVLGFVRTGLLAVALGGTALVGDIFETANTIPNVIYMLLAGGMFNVVLVPQLIKAAKQPDRGADYTSRLLTLATIILAIFTLLLTLAAYPIISALTLDWSQEMLILGTAFALWTLPQIFFYGMYAVIGQILNANAKFGWYMWAPVLNNVIAIGVIGSYIITFGQYAGEDQLAGWTTQQTIWLAGGHTAGIAVQALLLLWPLARVGIPIRPRFGWRGMGLGTTGKIAAWTLGTMAVGNIASLLYRRLISGATASREELSEGVDPASVPGGYAANTAELITVLPHSVFVLSIATVLFNQLARSMDLGHIDRAREIINEGLRMFAIPVMFSMMVIIVLAGPLGRLFAGDDPETAHLSAAAIGQLLILLALGMPFRSANFYLIRVFYSAEDARAPMIVQSVIAGLGLTTSYGLSFVLPNEVLPYLVVGMYSGLHVLQYIICHVWVVRRWGGFGFGSVLSAYTRTGICAAGSAVAGAAVLWLLGGYSWGLAFSSIPGAILTCAVVSLVMGMVFLLALRALRVREFADVMAPLARRIPALARLSR